MIERKFSRVLRDEDNRISGMITEEVEVPSFRDDSDGFEIRLDEIKGFAVSIGGPESDGTIRATHRHLFTSLGEAEAHADELERQARGKGYLGLATWIHAIPRSVDIDIEPPVRAVAKLEGRMSTNGHRVGFGFVGGSS